MATATVRTTGFVATLTTEHPASNAGLPVLVWDGHAYKAADLLPSPWPAGPRLVSAADIVQRATVVCAPVARSLGKQEDIFGRRYDAVDDGIAEAQRQADALVGGFLRNF